MNELIQMVFDDYEYEKRWNCENTDFYMNLNKNIANYFLVSYIDATSESESGDSILEKLKALENNYIGEFATSMEMAGVSISLLRLDEELKKYLLMPCSTPFFVQK